MSAPTPHSICDRSTREGREAAQLASYAMRSVDTVGRRYNESPDPHRTIFERDRDRITHSTAFRRLQYKTQVFLNDEGTTTAHASPTASRCVRSRAASRGCSG